MLTLDFEVCLSNNLDSNCQHADTVLHSSPKVVVFLIGNIKPYTEIGEPIWQNQANSNL